MRTCRLMPIALLALLALAPLAARAQVRVEYVAHACFVIESPAGTRVVIDPYNGTRWLGYGFPDDLPADVVLVTHPHYDHDASYYFPERVPTLREPGRYRVGDVAIQGIRGRHADPYGTEFGQKNTIWRIEVGDLSLAHLGDNGPPDAAALAALEGVDVLMLPVDGLDHILRRDQVAALRESLRPAITIPMHYRLELSGLPESLGPIEPWLEGRSDVVRLDSHRTTLGVEPGTPPRVVVFQARPGLALWPPALREAWGRRDAIRDAIASREPTGLQDALALLHAASEAAPGAMLVRYQLAQATLAAGQEAKAMALLERALVSAGGDDHEYTLRARALLAALYAGAGRRDEAALQYGLVLRGAERTELREAAEAFLGSQR